MKYLIDTHILIWYMEGNAKLKDTEITIIDNPENLIYISNVSLWEMTIKSSLKKLDLFVPVLEMQNFFTEKGFQLHSFNYQHLNILHSLPFHHGDPFDRLIITQAIFDDFTIISDDKQFKNYNVKLHI